MSFLSYLNKLGLLRYLIFILPLVVLSSVANADQKSAHKEGKEIAKAQKADMGKKRKSYRATDVPGFKTDKPAEAGMDVGQLAARKATILDTNEHAGFLAKSINEKPFVKIDPINDPAIRHAQQAAANPLEAINQVESFSSDDSEATRHTCEESEPARNFVCSQTRHIETEVPTIRTHVVTLEVRSRRWKHGLGRNIISGQKLDQYYVHPKGKFEAYTKLINPLPPGSFYRVESVKLLNGNSRTTLNDNGDLWIRTVKRKNGHRLNLDFSVDVEITYRPVVQSQDIREHIEDTCGPLKTKVEKGLCKFIKEAITEGSGARDFNDHAITRPWWKKESTYQCNYSSLNNCEPYRQQGCDQVASTCKTKVGETCAVSAQTFLCRKASKLSSRPSEHGMPFCVDGNCSEPEFVANKDMMEAVSRLSVLQDIQGEITKDNLFVFKGDSNSCSKNIANFKDCCGSGKGWGKSIGLASCSAEEKQLAKNRSNGLCRKIGTYCADKLLGICIKEKTTFCCFPSKIAKVFHEQGRAQLGLGWGDKHHPDCRGFTIEEISRLDFSKLDLRELYSEIRKNMKKPDLNKIKNSLQNRVEVMVLDDKKEAKVG